MKKRFLFSLLAVFSAVIRFGGVSLADNVASITKNEVTTYYESLRAALTAADEGDTIKMLANDNMSFAADTLSLIIDKSITIDGNGKYVYGVHNPDMWNPSTVLHGIIISGNVDVTINSLVLSDFGDTYYVNKRIAPIRAIDGFGGILTLSGVIIEKYNRDAIVVKGGEFLFTNLTINGNPNSNKGVNNHTCQFWDYGPGNYNHTNWLCEQTQQGIQVYNASGIIENTIITNVTNNGSTWQIIKGEGGGMDFWNCYAVLAWNGANVIIKNSVLSTNNLVSDYSAGVYSDDANVILENTTVSVNNSVITGNVEIVGTNPVEREEISINDGQGEAVFEAVNGGTITVNGGNYIGALVMDNGSIIIREGIFASNPVNYLMGGSIVENVGGQYRVTYDPAATIGENGYSTLQAAVTAANSGDVIKVKKDIVLSPALSLAEDKLITLDLDGHTLTGNTRVVTITNGTLIITGDGKMGLQSDGDLIRVEGGNCIIENGTFKGGTIVYDYGANSYVRINGGSFDGTSVGNRTAIHATFNAVMDIYGGDFVATVTNQQEGNNKNLKVIYAGGNNNRCDGGAGNDLIGGTINVYSGNFYGRLSKSNKGTYNIQGGTFRPTEVAGINCDYEEDAGICTGGKPNSTWCEYGTMQDMVADGYIAVETATAGVFEVKQQHTVTFDGTGAVEVVDGAKVAKPADPSNRCYTFSGWYNGDVLYDFNSIVTSNLTLTSKWKNYSCGSSSSSSSLGGSNSSDTTNDNVDSTSSEETTNEENGEANLELQNPETQEWYDNKGSQQEVLSNGLTREMNNAFEFAHRAGITTMKSAKEANMKGSLNRIAMAKMLSFYAINVLGQKPDKSKIPNFGDVSSALDSEYNDGVTLAYQLGIMGVGISDFRPYDMVPRAEFATALSRMLYGLADGTDTYYSTHVTKLMKEGIISVADPNMNELRGYVMLMLMRSAGVKATDSSSSASEATTTETKTETNVQKEVENYFSEAFNVGKIYYKVEDLKKLLTSLGYYHGTINNVYDSSMIDAIYDFQIGMGILDASDTTNPARGYMGPSTRAVLNQKWAEYKATR